MTTCELILKPITRMVEDEKKSLDEIAESVCPQVEYGREKIIRVIKDFLGDDYLIQHAGTLKYDLQKARLAKKRIRSTIREQNSHKKFDATANTDSSKKQCDKQESKSTAHDFNELVKEIKRLVNQFSLEDVKKAISIIEN
jgi:vacuolar-type H+-ATPase catalytic subunit A/Vma1